MKLLRDIRRWGIWQSWCDWWWSVELESRKLADCGSASVRAIWCRWRLTVWVPDPWVGGRLYDRE